MARSRRLAADRDYARGPDQSPAPGGAPPCAKTARMCEENHGDLLIATTKDEDAGAGRATTDRFFRRGRAPLEQRFALREPQGERDHGDAAWRLTDRDSATAPYFRENPPWRLLIATTKDENASWSDHDDPHPVPLPKGEGTRTLAHREKTSLSREALAWPAGPCFRENPPRRLFIATMEDENAGGWSDHDDPHPVPLPKGEGTRTLAHREKTSLSREAVAGPAGPCFRENPHLPPKRQLDAAARGTLPSVQPPPAAGAA